MLRTIPPNEGGGGGDHHASGSPAAVLTSPSTPPSTPLPSVTPAAAPYTSPLSPPPEILPVPTVAPKTSPTLLSTIPTTRRTSSLVTVSDRPKYLSTPPPAVLPSTTKTTIIRISDPGPIIGLVFLGFIVLAIIGCLTYCVWKICKKRKKQVCALSVFQRNATGDGEDFCRLPVQSTLVSSSARGIADQGLHDVEMELAIQSTIVQNPDETGTVEVQRLQADCETMEDNKMRGEESDRTHKMESNGVENIEENRVSNQSEVIDEHVEVPNCQREDIGDRDGSPMEIDLHAAHSSMAIMHHHDAALRSNALAEPLDGEDSGENQAPVVELVQLYEARRLDFMTTAYTVWAMLADASNEIIRVRGLLNDLKFMPKYFLSLV